VPDDEQHALLDLMIPDSGRAGRDMSLAGVPVDAERVKCPVLVVTAEDDRFVPPRVVARVAERYGAPLLTVPAHGHMVILEPEWEDLADRVERWIRARV
jgi:Poly(3-hydroxyalkanoate) synthetase